MVTDTLTAALRTLNIPVHRLTYSPKAGRDKHYPDTYITFQTILSKPTEYADDDSTVVLHTFRVDIYTSKDFTKILSQTIKALKQADFTISEVDGEMYENDTGLYHVPITINFMEE